MLRDGIGLRAAQVTAVMNQLYVVVDVADAIAVRMADGFRQTLMDNHPRTPTLVSRNRLSSKLSRHAGARIARGLSTH